MNLDEINLNIIKQLRDGRKTIRNIAKDLRISENTVRSRIDKLLSEDVLEISGWVNPEVLDGHRLIIVCVKLKSTTNVAKKCEELNKLKGVVFSHVVTGHYDIILGVLLKPNLDLLEFFTVELAKIKAIQFTETFVVYKSYNSKVPYL